MSNGGTKTVWLCLLSSRISRNLPWWLWWLFTREIRPPSQCHFVLWWSMSCHWNQLASVSWLSQKQLTRVVIYNFQITTYNWCRWGWFLIGPGGSSWCQETNIRRTFLKSVKVHYESLAWGLDMLNVIYSIIESSDDFEWSRPRAV